MTKFNKKTFFLMIMIMSTVMVMSSNKWLSVWMGMEINMMMTIPFMFQNKSKELSEKIMTYFLTQAMGSIILLTSIMMKTYNLNFMIVMFTTTVSMMIKMGIPPFHMWMPEMLNKMDWITLLIMITLQKINPLIVSSQLTEQNNLLNMMMITAATVGSISGINQLSLSKIMAFSSINHMSWMMMCMAMKNNLWIKYFIVYALITATLCLTFNKNMSFYMNQLNHNMMNMNKMMMLTMMLNLGGIPPLPGFLLKWMTMESMMVSNYFFMMTIMIFSSMVTLLFYMKLMYTNMMLSSTMTKFKLMNHNKQLYLIMLINLITPSILLI
uniref:NADH-ubiquinone oxidoreductase chain 2 n=1 Tax=Cysteochila chiniana TaxID=2172476 RepID=A0A343WNL0_9HEMI|nr:NADH dehydrogenase subunit 2 [Cysteochila chiniana]AWD31586.1 NADH dehydrogenase subunit 2 [Cysteochila chiniana]